jgi:hypothetical protein
MYCYNPLFITSRNIISLQGMYFLIAKHVVPVPHMMRGGGVTCSTQHGRKNETLYVRAQCPHSACFYRERNKWHLLAQEHQLRQQDNGNCLPHEPTLTRRLYTSSLEPGSYLQRSRLFFAPALRQNIWSKSCSRDLVSAPRSVFCLSSDKPFCVHGLTLNSSPKPHPFGAFPSTTAHITYADEADYYRARTDVQYIIILITTGRDNTTKAESFATYSAGHIVSCDLTLTASDL